MSRTSIKSFRGVCLKLARFWLTFFVRAEWFSMWQRRQRGPAQRRGAGAEQKCGFRLPFHHSACKVECTHFQREQGAFARCLAGLQAEWLIWPDWVGIAGSISARSVIETSQRGACKVQRLHAHDVRSALACMESAQHTWRTTWANNTSRNKGPGAGRAQSGRPQPSWSERKRDCTDHRNQLAQGVGDHDPDRTWPDEKLRTGRHVQPPFKLLFETHAFMERTDRQTDRHTDAQ